MKLKIKPAYIGLLLIALMLGSTLAYSFLHTVPTQQLKQIELPNTNIIDYELTSDQKSLLIAYGWTIITYKYNNMCPNCLVYKQLLEQIASSDKFKNQIFLEEMFSSGETVSKLNIISYAGEKSLVNATENEIFNALCDLLLDPPVECVLRKV